MLEKLLGLGFTTHVCTATIDGTIDRMYQQIETRPEIDDAVFKAVRDDAPDGVCKENYDERLFDWVMAQAKHCTQNACTT